MAAQTSENQQAIMDMVVTVLSYKFIGLTRPEVEAMLGITLQETQLYKDVKQEGREEESQMLVLRQLVMKLGSVPETLRKTIAALSLEQTEDLAVALLSFSTLADLEIWLRRATCDRLLQSLHDKFGPLPDELRLQMEGRSLSVLESLEAALSEQETLAAFTRLMQTDKSLG